MAAELTLSQSAAATAAIRVNRYSCFMVVYLMARLIDIIELFCHLNRYGKSLWL
jgi:hypothetical protein